MKKSAAFFDMDHTLIWENAGQSSARLSLNLGFIKRREVLKGGLFIALYRLGLLDITAWYEQSISSIAGASKADMLNFGKLWFEQEVCNKSLYREGVALIEDHRRRGHELVILSNSPDFFVESLATGLNIDHTVCTRLEMIDGHYSGKIIKPLCYGPGKREFAKRWADENNIDLGSSYFYTDSHFDLEALEIFGNPVATNPDFKLRKIARQRDWKILDFKKITVD